MCICIVFVFVVVPATVVLAWADKAAIVWRLFLCVLVEAIDDEDELEFGPLPHANCDIFAFNDDEPDVDDDEDDDGDINEPDFFFDFLIYLF